MTDRKRLIEVIENSTSTVYGGEYGDEVMEPELDIDEKSIERIADSVLEDGWIRPACKVGDTAYFVIEDKYDIYVSEEKITDVSTRGFMTGTDYDFTPYSEVNKSVFFSMPEADKAVDDILNKIKI